MALWRSPRSLAGEHNHSSCHQHWGCCHQRWRRCQQQPLQQWSDPPWKRVISGENVIHVQTKRHKTQPASGHHGRSRATTTGSASPKHLTKVFCILTFAFLGDNLSSVVMRQRWETLLTCERSKDYPQSQTTQSLQPIAAPRPNVHCLK